MKRISLVFIASLLLSPVLNAEQKVWFNFGEFDFHIPFSKTNVVGLWDGVSKSSLAGTETALISYKKIKLTGGAVTSISDIAGTPYIGIHADIPNPLENYVVLSTLQPGIFGGRNFRNNEWLLGLKMSANLF